MRLDVICFGIIIFLDRRVAQGWRGLAGLPDTEAPMQAALPSFVRSVGVRNSRILLEHHVFY